MLGAGAVRRSRVSSRALLTSAVTRPASAPRIQVVDQQTAALRGMISETCRSSKTSKLAASFAALYVQFFPDAKTFGGGASEARARSPGTEGIQHIN